MQRRLENGVTIIELLLVMVIVAMLVAVAIPSYRQYTLRANRAEGHAMLLQAAANQERFYLDNSTYATQSQISEPLPDGLGLRGESLSGHYGLRIAAADDNAFILVATARGEQAADESCAVFAIDETGARYGGAGPAFAANNDASCW